METVISDVTEAITDAWSAYADYASAGGWARWGWTGLIALVIFGCGWLVLSRLAKAFAEGFRDGYRAIFPDKRAQRRELLARLAADMRQAAERSV